MRVCFFRIVVLLLALTFAPLPAFAQQEHFDMGKLQAIPDYGDEISNEEFQAKSELYEEHPYGDRFIAFRVRLPKGWFELGTDLEPMKKMGEKAPEKPSERILGRVSKYYGPGRIDELTRFEIHAQSLEHEVTAKTWFMQEVLTRGYILEGLTVISNKRVEAQYVTVEKDTSFIVRAAIEINGSRIVIAAYYVPNPHWEEERAFQQRAIQSFHFLNPEKGLIEPIRRHSFLDLLSFAYPASWRLVAPQVFSVDGMQAMLVYSIDSQTMSGEIHISVLAADQQEALQDELSFLKQELTNRGLTLDKMIEVKNDYKKPDHVKYNHTEIYRAVDESEKVVDHEYWVAILEEDRYFYLVTMLTPARDREYFTWARNAEAFQTVVESFEP